MKYESTILKVAIHSERENPIFGDGNIYISVEDEAGGPFLIIEQDTEERGIRIEYEELLAVADASKMLMNQRYLQQTKGYY